MKTPPIRPRTVSMRFGVLGASTLVLASLAGCQATTKEDVRQAHEVAQETESAYIRDRALYVAGLLEERMTELDGRIAEAKTLCGDLDGQPAAECHDVMRALQQRRDALGARAEYLRENANEMARMAVDREWESIDQELQSISQMLDQLESIAQPGEGDTGERGGGLMDEGDPAREPTMQEDFEGVEGLEETPQEDPFADEPMK